MKKEEILKKAIEKAVENGWSDGVTWLNDIKSEDFTAEDLSRAIDILEGKSITLCFPEWVRSCIC